MKINPSDIKITCPAKVYMSQMDKKCIKSAGYNNWIKWTCFLVVAVFVVLGLYTVFIEDRTTAQPFMGVLLCLLCLASGYEVYQLEIRVHSDRVEQRRFALKTILYRDVGRIHLSDTDPYRIRVYEKGAATPGIGIHNGIADWRRLGATLLACLPDSVECTGSEKLRKELEKLPEAPSQGARS